MALKLPYHACYHLEAEADLRLIDIEPVRKADALIRNFDVKVSVNFPGVDLNGAATFGICVFERVCDEFVDQEPQWNCVIRRKEHRVGITM